MEIMTSWGREGMEKGRQQGKEELVARLLRRRFGSVPTQVIGRLDRLTAEQLNELGEALFDFTKVTDVETWLSQHTPQ